MRFAPPPSLRLVSENAGVNQTTVRSTNERVILSLLVRYGALSRFEIGQMSGLSAQTVSVISRALQRDGLIIAGEALRGRVGPPTIPMTLNPDGAYAIGLGLAEHGLDSVVMGVTGQCHARDFRGLDPGDDPVAALEQAVEEMMSSLSVEERGRVAGIGLGLPSGDGPWGPKIVRALADGAALEERLGRGSGLPVYIQNGVTAAAGGESIFGSARDLSDFLFVFIGLQTEFRVVLSHRVYSGRRIQPNANDLATSAAQTGSDRLWNRSDDLDGVLTDGWATKVAEAIAADARKLQDFVAFDTLLLTGLLPGPVRDEVTRRLAAALADVKVISGELDAASTAVGAAAMALSARFLFQEQGQN